LIPAEFRGLLELARRARYEPCAVEVLPGDVGRRRYLRLAIAGEATVLGVFYPAEEEGALRRWLAARAVLSEAGVRVPRVYAEDGIGNQILEDFGPEDLAMRLAAHPAERPTWLGRAADVARSIAGAADSGVNAAFDAPFFRRELDLAREAVFDLWLEASLSAEERAIHDDWAAAVAREIEGHPRVLCHRDFHGNNLFPAGDVVAAIDFQDMRSGPDTYDLASLLWERTTLDWMTEDCATGIVREFAESRGASARDFTCRMERVLLQRAWKVCGTFARAVSQNRGETYRRYLPGELRLVRRLLTAPADARFRGVFEARLGGLC
jgi:aminoglycoside/choline kinase family phosphotransferase